VILTLGLDDDDDVALRNAAMVGYDKLRPLPVHDQREPKLLRG
jgi:hypothetical protein